MRFESLAPFVVANPERFAGQTIGDFMDAKRFGRPFREYYMVPMCCAIWSSPVGAVSHFPAVWLMRFIVNHHLHKVTSTQRPVWRVVKNGSYEYVKRMIDGIGAVRTGTAVTHIRRNPGRGGGFTLTAESAKGRRLSQDFDDVVLTVHTDVALRILGSEVSDEYRNVLTGIPYQANAIYLHADRDWMPKSKDSWASWNVVSKREDAHTDASPVCMSYWANRLANLPKGTRDLFVTLNPARKPPPQLTLVETTFSHPIFSPRAEAMQRRLREVQGEGGVWLAGAWTGYGFHEDGIKSAVRVCEGMGARVPWTPKPCSPELSYRQRFFLGVFDAFMKVAITEGHLRVILPTGEERSYGDEAPLRTVSIAGSASEVRLASKIRVLHADFFEHAVVRSDIGLGEAFFKDLCEPDDLYLFLTLFSVNLQSLNSRQYVLGVCNWLGNKAAYVHHWLRSNTLANSKSNIEEHYDAGNAMYKLFLDPRMIYSSAIYESAEDTLEQAQVRKLVEIAERCEVKEGDSVLEIGFGWGAMAILLATKYKCKVTGITLSTEQLEEAMLRVKRAGLQDRITLLLCDYRKIPGHALFDRVISIEMIEAVGHEHMGTYFETISKWLKPGGKAAIQAISIPDERYAAYKVSSDFIKRHIFPGGHLPCMAVMLKHSRTHDLTLCNITDIGMSYARTLKEWRANWEREEDGILKLGYSRGFHRKWSFYFAYCETGFQQRLLHDFILTFTKEDKEGGVGVGEMSAGKHHDALNGHTSTIKISGFVYFLIGLLFGTALSLWRGVELPAFH